MQIAQVIPKIKTQAEGIFDYAIPPRLLPLMKPGILVSVPFRNRKVDGIVIELKRTTKIKDLKEIIAIIDPEPAIDGIHLKLATWMSKYYFAPISKTLFENIIPPARRFIKKHAGETKSQYSALEVLKAEQKSKRYLIVSDFKSRLQFYMEAIRQTELNGKQTIILVPDLENVEFFSKILNKSSLIHAGLTLTERFKIWDEIRNNKVKIIIGSVSALFAPVRNLGLVIVDQEENETYKSDRSPYYHALTVAEELTKITGANLIAGSVCPRIETFHKTNNDYILKFSRPKYDGATIINMNFERGILSQSLKDQIEEMLEQKKKVLLLLNRKGEGFKLTCQDCDWTNLCPNCQLPLKPIENFGVCSRCEKNFPLPKTCPNCHGINLKPLGMGTAKLQKILKANFPEANIIKIEKKFSDDKKTALPANWDIAVTTSYGLKFNYPPISLVGIIEADHILSYADFYSSQKEFQTMFKFLRLAPTGIIQTRLPENNLIGSLSKLDYQGFYQAELAEREKNQLPPFKKLIRLIYKHTDELICVNETERVFKLLNKLAKENNLAMELLGPLKLNTSRKLNSYYRQIIIKIDPKINNQIMSDLLRHLPSYWSIDVDPVEMF